MSTFNIKQSFILCLFVNTHCVYSTLAWLILLAHAQTNFPPIVLDLILTNMSDTCDSPKVIAPIGLSDHNSVLCKSLNGCKKIRPGNRGAKAAFGRWLTNYNSTNLYHTALCEQKLELFQDVIRTGLDHFLPCKVVKMHDRDKPWITPAYIRNLLKADKRHFFRKMTYCTVDYVIVLIEKVRTLYLHSYNINWNIWKVVLILRNGGTLWNIFQVLSEETKSSLESNLLKKLTRLSYPLLEIFLLLALSLPLIPNYKAIILLFQPSTLLRKTFIINYLQYHLRKRLAQMKYRIGF
jgi:hypothetical protein